MSEKDIKVVNTPDADIVATFNLPDVHTIKTRNALLTEAKKRPATKTLCTST